MNDTSSSPVPSNEREGDIEYQPAASLSGTVAWSLKWKLASQLTREGTRIVVAVILARILTPEQWGLATMALVVGAFVEMIPDNMSVGLIQRSRITQLDISTIFWTTIVMGVGMAALGIAVSGQVAEWYGEPQVEGLFAAVSVGFAITASVSIPETLLVRNFAYRALELRQIAGVLVGGAVAITLALAGAGPWAIIGNSLAALTTSAVLLWWFAKWRPSLLFSRSTLASLGGQGVRVMGSQLLTLTQLYADKILVGRYLGAGPLGTYSFAYQLMFTPVGNIAYPVQYVLFPVFASIQEDAERLNAAWLRTKRLSVALMAPAFLTMLVLGPDLIPAVFGSRWEDSVPVLQLLCVAGVAYSLSTQNWTLLVVRGRSGTLLALTLLTCGVVVGSAAVGLNWGVQGVAAMLGVAYWILVIPDMFVTTRAGSMPFGAAFRATLSPLPFVLVASATAFLFRVLLVELSVPAGLRIVLVGAVLVLVYGALAYVGSTPLRKEGELALGWVRNRRLERRTSTRSLP
ncbi:MAG: lipopolysaccharide biosynthesis protein [Actinomycetota bacterium]|nr:lipopolysaccharide biosynthesis protein [Actinomycetota bacterium]